jgi:glycosyltransferase involved in cell wall biosynthesis
LQSVKNQTYKNLEVVLINDGSTDNSLEIAENFRNDFGLYEIISIENSGQAEAKNRGLQVCTGEFVTFLDADDELEAEMIAVCLKKMLENDVDLVISKFAIFNEKGNSEMISGWKSRNREITQTKDLYLEMFNYGISETVWAKFFKANFAKQIVFEQGLWFDDRPFLFEYLFIAKTVSFEEKALLKIHKRGSSITRRILEPKRIIDWHCVFELELKIATKYSSDKQLKEKIAKHYLSVLTDNFLIQIIEKKQINNLKHVRETFLNQVKEFSIRIKFEKITLKDKDFLILILLQFPNFFGWTFSNSLFQILKGKRIQAIKKLK